ncbi:hypothetical protein BH23GEM9_BH23GEM9_00110 [soil metagenome]
MRGRVQALVLPVLPALLAVGPGVVAGQEWRLGMQYGQLRYEGTGVEATQQSSIAVGLSRSAYNGWFGASAGRPLDGGAYWAAAGAARRLRMDAAAGLGLDLTAHGFAQRLEVSTSSPTPPFALPVQPGSGHEVAAGGGGQGAVVGFARVAQTRLEVRGGVAGRALGMQSTWEYDHVAVADGRLVMRLGPVQAGPDAQHWHGRSTYAGGSASVGSGPFVGWTSAGQWTHGGPDGVTWSAGGGVNLPGGIRIDASYRNAGLDPLYRQTTGPALAMGASMRLGGGDRYAPPVPASYARGQAIIRVRARDVRGAPRIAGDFTDWQPVAMTAAGDAWSVNVALAPGVYHYAFVTEDGEWFVPESTPGRRSDGMGGHVAVLVVSE